tara:strand:+ start:497 stop:709 length:213 start_codon:yes stop_codon:yes gene_type:complete
LAFYTNILKKNKSGFFDSPVYWPRLLHAATYMTAAILLLIEDTRKYAFWLLVADIIIGFFFHFLVSLSKK